MVEEGDIHQPEPRWAPDRPLSERVTRRGRFRKLDPSRPGGVWKLRRWLALGAWAVLLAGAFAKAWREAGQVAGRSTR